MKLITVSLLSALAVTLCKGISARAENPATSGDIEIESTEVKPRSGNSVAQDQASEFLKSMESFAKGGGTGSVPTLTDGAAQHLSVMYLFCLKKLGPCPFILDSVLEADVAAARVSGAAECPSMSRFWRKWLDNELEQRVKFLLSVSNMSALASFNTIERPKYVRCKETVAELKGTTGRYGEGGPSTVAIVKTAKLLADISSRSIDIYGAVGLTVASAPASAAAGKKAK